MSARLRLAAGATLVMLALASSGCLEAPFAPPPKRSGLCVATSSGPFTCSEGCAGQVVEASVSCASTLEGTFDADQRVCRFSDGSSADFGAPLGSLSEVAIGERPFSLTMQRSGKTCLQLHIDPAPEHDSDPPRTTELVVGQRACYQQRVTYAPKPFESGLHPVEVELLCEQQLLRGSGSELCGSCPQGSCDELPLLRVELAEDTAGVVDVRLVAGDRVTPLLSCRRPR